MPAIRSSLGLLLAMFLLAACQTKMGGIEVANTTCCPPLEYQTFQVNATNIPAFLGPLMVSNFTVAMANHGLQPVDNDGDLIVDLSFKQINLAPDDESKRKPDFAERISTGDAVRFIARINIDVRAASDNSLVWAGHIQREHVVGPGEYMHIGPASVSVFEAFVEVLQSFPVMNIHAEEDAAAER